jgi:two-component system, OmpR family, sensor kinase
MPHKPIPPNQPDDQANELLGVVAHELRRPLTALLGALATLQHRREVLSSAQQQELAGIAHRQAEQLHRLLDQLLRLTSLDQPHLGLARRSLVDVAALAAEAGQAARLAHPDHPVAIDLAGPLLVRADPLAVTSILGNLLDNAAAHTPPGTPIQLAAGQDGRHAILTVQDHGPGIPHRDRDRIFDRYARVGRPPNRSGAGIGLGLYIARRLARANRGELRLADPSGGRGARFELRLPLATPTPAGKPARPHP